MSVGAEPASARCASILTRAESLGSSGCEYAGKLLGPAALLVSSHQEEELLERQSQQWYLDLKCLPISVV